MTALCVAHCDISSDVDANDLFDYSHYAASKSQIEVFYIEQVELQMCSLFIGTDWKVTDRERSKRTMHDILSNNADSPFRLMPEIERINCPCMYPVSLPVSHFLSTILMH